MDLLALITGWQQSAAWPFVILIISITAIILFITVLRIHAFFALILAAMIAGLLAPAGGLPGEPVRSHWVESIELTTTEMGATAGRIGVVIALAAVISLCLMESGAADKVVRRFLAFFGERRAGTAIVVSSYILSIPIFFDTFFMLLLPLARALCIRTGKDYLLYVMAICCGGTVTHSLIAPHPGPLAMAETLKIDLGLTIMVGVIVGIVPVAASWLVTKWLNARIQIPLREAGGVSIADLKAFVEKDERELPSFGWSIAPVILPILLISLASVLIAIQGKGFEINDVKDARGLIGKLRDASDPISKLIIGNFTPTNRVALEKYDAGQPPSEPLQKAVIGELNQLIRSSKPLDAAFFAKTTLRPETVRMRAYGPQSENLVRLNRLLIEDAFPAELSKTSGLPPALFHWGDFIGNRNVALIIGALIAVGVLVRQKGIGFEKLQALLGPPFETAGVIILITSAGGAFGLMLKNAGVGDAIQAAVAGREVNLILLSWAVAAVIRIAQGSATVAMLTTAAMIYQIINSGNPLPYHEIYIFMAIGFGAMVLSWMNDSGFWVVGRLSGFTEQETLKSWTIIVSVNSVAGLATTLLLAKLLPLR